MMVQKKRTRSSEKTRAHILQTAFGLIFFRGFQGVSVDDIVAETGLTKGAFYHHFPTKLELGYAIADEVIRELILNRWIRPLEKYENPVQGIILQLKKVIDETPDANVELGCPLNNLTQEMSTVDPVFREKLQADLSLWLNEIEGVLRRGRDDGFLKEHVAPRQLAVFVVTLHEGMYAMGKTLKDKNVWYSLYDSLRMHLEFANRAS